MRYQQLDSLLKQYKPTSILEIGTCRGDRAIQMMSASNAFCYFGFDLFDQATQEDDLDEFNVKPHFSAIAVRNRFKFPNKLYQGYTRETLPIFIEEYGEHRVDFAFIDGGHSIDTIRNDWEFVKRIVKPEGVVVFDDYYPDAPEEILSKYGANKVLNEIGEYELLPDIDPVVGGFHVQLAYV